MEMLHQVLDGITDQYKTNLNLERLEYHMLEFLKCNTILSFNYELNDLDVSKYMDCLGKNLVRSYLTEENLEIHIFIKQLQIVQKKMRFLRYLYAIEINGYVGNEKLECLETRIQFMANNLGQLCFAISDNVFSDFVDKDEDEDKDDILNKHPYLLFLIVLVSKFTHSRTFKDKKLPKGSSLHLQNLLMYLENKKLNNFLDNVSVQNIDVAIEFLLVFLDVDVSNHLFPGSINKDDTSKISLCSIQILEKTKDLKAQVETYYKYLKFTPSQFPIIGGLNFLDFLLRKLNEMSKSESDLDFEMKPLLEKELSSLSSIFKDVAKVYHEHKIPKDLQRCINLAYEVEVAIDSILVQYNAFFHIFCSLPTISKEIKQINAQMTEMWSTDFALKPYYVVAPFKHLPTRHSNPVIDEEIVGYGNDIEKLDVIPIIGMGGQRKTTIARKVYNSENIVSHFDVRAWCIISQIYNRRTLLQENLNNDDILTDMVRKSLVGKRYLIVLDDMWDCMAWDDLRLYFLDIGNRSKIAVTTRLEEVGKQVKYHTDPYSLSQAVVEKCKRLPLVVFLVAGIIKKRKMEESWWNVVKDALFDYLDRESEESIWATMQLSFDYLHNCLKPWLLCMGMFPEDARILLPKLISLWIVEDFVENIESAEDYLMNLISSNVVMVSKKKYNGKVKYCQVHDLVLHFCLEKRREEKFMLVRRDPSCQILKLRLLKILDLSSHKVCYVSTATLKPLKYLKYLAIWANKFYFHLESHLPHLETLIVNNWRNLVLLLASFWEMRKLRHAEIAEAEFDTYGLFEGFSKLENLRILKNIITFTIDRVDVLSRRCPNLQQLHIHFENDSA
ncbi:hypothetical protein R3W88_024902 [Solanum pinnatisectum]|uniref:Uncharacterized protein n=1 Tax=Solanum pinnatisectum TaxID=50273 RepID=A0AAV9M4W3_9SOLN|nr:hypothetical protein R3W88_024902 [Solanum pinnatisectum]